MLQHSWYDGTRSQSLADFILSTVGFYVPVPGPVDAFKVDAFLHLIEREERGVRPTGRLVAFQVKSDSVTNIAIKEKWERDVLFETPYPFFVISIDKAKMRFKIYTAFHRLALWWNDPSAKVVLTFGDKFDEVPQGSIRLDLGAPIAEYDVAWLEVSNPQEKAENRQHLYHLILGWAILEHLTLAWKADRVPFLPVPPSYETNKLLNIHGIQLSAVCRSEYLQPLMGSMFKTMTCLKTFCDGVDQAPLQPKQVEQIQAISAKASELRDLCLAISDSPALPADDSGDKEKIDHAKPG
jgi:hypothetical protein